MTSLSVPQLTVAAADAPSPDSAARAPVFAVLPKSLTPEQRKKIEELRREQKTSPQFNGGAKTGVRMKPLGYAGMSPKTLKMPKGAPPNEDFLPIVDRWRIGFPDWDRYPRGTPGEYPYVHGHWWDPYNQNWIKGDYPVWGQHTFFDFTGVSDTIGEFRRLPTPSGPFAEPGGRSENFFGGGNQTFVTQNWITSFELFHGDAGFKPLDWAFKFTPVWNVNYLSTQERGIVNVNPSEGTTRNDFHIGIQELFGQYKIADLSPDYDFMSVRAGVQGFQSDFRGFIYSDDEPGFRFFGNYDDNIYNWNVAYFEQLDKDTNSGLNTVFRTRGQHVVLANLTRQDFLFKGYDAQLDFDYNNDSGGTHYDNNGFLVRPADVGVVRAHTINVAYFGFTGNGHIGRINVSNAFYEATGRDSFNEIAGHSVNVNAQMGALELSYDRDWLRYKVSFFYASGDGNIKDHTASGFDDIIGNPDFAGGGFSFWDRQNIPLAGTGVNLTNRFSLLPNLRSSELQGQSNFVNPGLLLYNAGVRAELTPELRADFNFNFVQFDKVGALEQLLHQNNLGHDVGLDWSLGLIYRPLLINNVIFQVGAALFNPMSGFRNIYTGQTLFSGFIATTLTY